MIRWLCESRFGTIVLIAIAALIYLVLIGGALPWLWPYREYALVRLLLAFIYGDHLPEALDELGSGL
jgi:hypothetical protein